MSRLSDVLEGTSPALRIDPAHFKIILSKFSPEAKATRPPEPETPTRAQQSKQISPEKIIEDIASCQSFPTERNSNNMLDLLSGIRRRQAMMDHLVAERTREANKKTDLEGQRRLEAWQEKERQLMVDYQNSLEETRKKGRQELDEWTASIAKKRASLVSLIEREQEEEKRKRVEEEKRQQALEKQRQQQELMKKQQEERKQQELLRQQQQQAQLLQQQQALQQQQQQQQQAQLQQQQQQQQQALQQQQQQQAQLQQQQQQQQQAQLQQQQQQAHLQQQQQQTHLQHQQQQAQLQHQQQQAQLQHQQQQAQLQPQQKQQQAQLQQQQQQVQLQQQQQQAQLQQRGHLVDQQRLQTREEQKQALLAMEKKASANLTRLIDQMDPLQRIQYEEGRQQQQQQQQPPAGDAGAPSTDLACEFEEARKLYLVFSSLRERHVERAKEIRSALIALVGQLSGDVNDECLRQQVTRICAFISGKIQAPSLLDTVVRVDTASEYDLTQSVLLQLVVEECSTKQWESLAKARSLAVAMAAVFSLREGSAVAFCRYMWYICPLLLPYRPPVEAYASPAKHREAIGLALDGKFDIPSDRVNGIVHVYLGVLLVRPPAGIRKSPVLGPHLLWRLLAGVARAPGLVRALHPFATELVVTVIHATAASLVAVYGVQGAKLLRALLAAVTAPTGERWDCPGLVRTLERASAGHFSEPSLR